MTESSTILLVEDNADDVFFMKRALLSAQIKNPVQVASDGQAAIDYLRGSGMFSDRVRYPSPCLVFLDLKLPGKSGHEVLQWIREESPTKTLVVILLTTSREPRDIQHAYNLGCNGFLVKPGTPPQLHDMISAVKHFWLCHNTFPA